MEEKIRELVGAVFAPEQIESVKVFNGRAIVTLQNAVENPEVTGRLKSAISEMDGIAKVSIVYTAPKANIGLKPENPKWEIKGVRKIIGVASGKGGVGKSMVTSQLAVAVRREGYNVAILDADVTGPSIPKSFGIHEHARGTEDMLIPCYSNKGTQIMSVNLILDNETDPVVWRGPVIAGVVTQFWSDVLWDDVDYMFVDMPPGTGDVPLTVFQSLPIDGIVIVTSPQELVSMIVAKAVNMAKLMNIPVLGIVENMSYFKCPDCGKEHEIFGSSKVEQVAKEYGIEHTARLPIDPVIATMVDAGEIESIDADALNELADFIEKGENA